MIYAMQSLDGGVVKIGMTSDVDRRRVQLERTYGTPLALLAVFPGGREEEARIHGQFAHLRIGRTEQFRPAPDLMEFLGRPLLVGANPEAVEAMGTVGSSLMVLQMRGTPEWKTWLEELAAFDDRSPASLGERAIRRYAIEIGFTEEPPKR